MRSCMNPASRDMHPVPSENPPSTDRPSSPNDLTNNNSQASDQNAASLVAQEALKRGTDSIRAENLSGEKTATLEGRVLKKAKTEDDAGNVLSMLPVSERKVDSLDQGNDLVSLLGEQQPILKKARKSSRNDNEAIESTLSKTDQLPESEPPFFEFDSDARNQSHLWKR